MEIEVFFPVFGMLKIDFLQITAQNSQKRRNNSWVMTQGICFASIRNKFEVSLRATEPESFSVEKYTSIKQNRFCFFRKFWQTLLEMLVRITEKPEVSINVLNLLHERKWKVLRVTHTSNLFPHLLIWLRFTMFPLF